MIVEVSETTMTLINKYQNTNQNSPYLFPILSGSTNGEELYTEYQQALRTMNYNLDRLAKKCGVSAKSVHTPCATPGPPLPNIVISPNN